MNMRTLAIVRRTVSMEPFFSVLPDYMGYTWQLVLFFYLLFLFEFFLDFFEKLTHTFPFRVRFDIDILLTLFEYLFILFCTTEEAIRLCR
jgi:hypothetical protein